MNKTFDNTITWETPKITILTTNNTCGKTTNALEGVGPASAKPGDGIS